MRACVCVRMCVCVCVCVRARALCVRARARARWGEEETVFINKQNFAFCLREIMA